MSDPPGLLIARGEVLLTGTGCGKRIVISCTPSGSDGATRRFFLRFAWTAYGSGDLGSAEASLRQAIALYPDDHEAHSNPGFVLGERGQPL